MSDADEPWWRRTTVYHIYPRSFADANGDGIGDLRGIEEKLDYLSWLGVETLWLSPIFTSPQADFGYDISDHYGIAPEYGTMDDCRSLLEAAHARGMKIVFDMVLNHTSNQHPWFLESRAATEGPRRDWYIWRKGRGARGEKRPNNWRSMLGGSGWHRDEASGEWYWATFLPFQPDLNYRNPDVREAMLDVVRYWLGEGVDGLRLDLFNAIYKDGSFVDNPFSFRPVPSETNPHGFFQRHVHTLDHPDTLRFARELRKVVDAVPGSPRFLVGEVFGDAATLQAYCGEPDDPGLHLVFLFQTMRTAFRASEVRELIAGFEGAFADPRLPTYVFGNHDRPRFLHRLGDDTAKAKLWATLQLTARGVPFLYYGDEVGMGHEDVPLAQGLDPIAARFGYVPEWLARSLSRMGILLNRDASRRPMQWSDAPNAGFAEEAATPWLPVHPRYARVNVAAQERDPTSLLSCYRELLALRANSLALCAGSLSLFDPSALPEDVVGYRRVHERHGQREVVDVLLNFGARSRSVVLPEGAGSRVFSNVACEESVVEGERVSVRPFEGVIILP